MRTALQILLAATLALGIAGLWFHRDWQRFVNHPVNPDSELVLWVAEGTTWRGLVRQLEWLGLARAGWHWRLLGRWRQPSLRVGEFQLAADLSPADLIDRLESGRVREHRLTIVEGWTAERLRRELAADPRLRQRTRGLETPQLMARLGCPDCAAEGRFLPETYFFTRPVDDLEVLQRAYDAMNRTLQEVWAGRADDVPLDSPQELLVLASVVERETGRAAERGRVAGVFARRLRLGMRLQTDPTVIYGLGDDFDGRLRRVHLRTDHPWNTYTRHGLPPTPIALPGRAALEAAARPAAGTALYFVARGDGSHQFSDTLEQHNAAVNRYIRGRP